MTEYEPIQVRGVYRKIGVSTRADAVAWAEAAGVG